MTVYVDRAFIRYGRMLMCHMVADTEQELHEMADAIGVKRKWFQANSRYPHYDVCSSMRDKAIALGAVSVSSRDIIDKAVINRRQDENSR